MKDIILIGGVPTSGKSSIAKLLAIKNSIPYISTDLIRAWAIATLGKDVYFKDYPNETNLKIEEYLGDLSIDEIVNREYLKAELLSQHVQTFIKSAWSWDKYIIEGTGISPKFAYSLKKSESVDSIFLIYKDKALIRDRIFSRGIWDEPKKYEDKYKEKEVECVWKWNQDLLSEVKKFGHKYIIIDGKSISEIAVEAESLLN